MINFEKDLYIGKSQLFNWKFIYIHIFNKCNHKHNVCIKTEHLTATLPKNFKLAEGENGKQGEEKLHAILA